MNRRPPAARRSWLFLPGAEAEALLAAPGSGADVLIQELEDFTPPARRPEARAASARVLGAWKGAGRVAAVRINPLAGGGREDLAAAMRGAPDVVLLPKCRAAAEVVELAGEVGRLEAELGLPAGTTELVPNIEDAAGLTRLSAIAGADPRVTACLVASEDMAADLGAERAPDGRELAYVRERFLVECTASGVLAIDCPYTFRDAAGLAAEAAGARRLGFRAKSAVMAEHVAAINAAFTPDPDALARARRIVAAFEAAHAAGRALAEVDGVQVELPVYRNACRLVERAVMLQAAGEGGR